MRYCDDLIKAGDEDRWLTTRFAPEALRARLLALFAFHAEIERIPHAVSEPPLGEIRLQWWREAIDEIVNAKQPRAHPVVQAMAATGACEKDAAPLMLGMIEARARLLYGDAFGSIEELARWCEETEGALAVAAARSYAAPSAVAVSRAGAAYGLARHGGALAPALAADIKPYAEEALREAASSLAGLEEAAASPLLYITLARRYLGKARAPSPLSKRLRLFRAAATGRLIG